jgi:hypothetical protein
MAAEGVAPDRAAVAEFHSDARRAIEVQMPWGVDDKWHTK